MHFFGKPSTFMFLVCLIIFSVIREPVLANDDNFQETFYTVLPEGETIRVNRVRSLTSLQVRDDFECLQKCNRRRSSPKSTCNMIKYSMEKNIGHQCELLTASYLFTGPSDFQRLESDGSSKLIITEQPRPHSCTDIRMTKGSGVYTIVPHTSPIHVFCDMETEGGGWTVIQRHKEHHVDFEQNWATYKQGFGPDLSRDFWLGLENLHLMTSQQAYRLRVDIESPFDGVKVYAEYDKFEVGDETSKYRLTVGNYTGTAGDCLSYHNGMKFSTIDQDNDLLAGGKCTYDRGAGGWWYNECFECNPNGRYYDPPVERERRWYVFWKPFRQQYPVKMEMKIRELP